MNLRSWVPPMPPEHGGKTLLGVALATPVSVSIGAGLSPSTETVVGYLFFTSFGIGLLFVREVAKQMGRVKRVSKQRYLVIGSIETLAVLGFVLGIGKLVDAEWVLLLVALPIVFLLGRQEAKRYPRPLLQAALGVIALGFLVPLGMLLLGFSNPIAVATVTGLFIMYHGVAVLRVGAVIETEVVSRKFPAGVAIGFFGLSVVGFLANAVGIGTVVVFLLATLSSALLGWTRHEPSLKQLGHWEALLGVGFVLSGPFLLP